MEKMYDFSITMWCVDGVQYKIGGWDYRCHQCCASSTLWNQVYCRLYAVSFCLIELIRLYEMAKMDREFKWYLGSCRAYDLYQLPSHAKEKIWMTFFFCFGRNWILRKLWFSYWLKLYIFPFVYLLHITITITAYIQTNWPNQFLLHYMLRT